MLIMFFLLCKLLRCPLPRGDPDDGEGDPIEMSPSEVEQGLEIEAKIVESLKRKHQAFQEESS